MEKHANQRYDTIFISLFMHVVYRHSLFPRSTGSIVRGVQAEEDAVRSGIDYIISLMYIFPLSTQINKV